MKIRINGKECEASQDETVLDVCAREGVAIPTLCSYGKLKREAACRLCLVEVAGTGRLETSCTLKVAEGMEVLTETDDVKRARKTNLELLFADHAGKCAKCRKNLRCELQKLAIEHRIDNFHFVPKKEDMTDRDELVHIKENRARAIFEDRNGAITRDSQYCVACRRCVNICPVREFSINCKGSDTVVSTPYEKELDCIFCGACVRHCPTGALTDHEDLPAIQEELNDLNKLAVAILDPAALSGIAKEIDLPESGRTEAVTGYLRALGFERVFSLSYGNGFWLEMAKEKMEAVGGMIIADYCPSLSLLVRKHFPDLSKHLLGLPSPDDLLAGHIKTEYAERKKVNAGDMVTVAISPCTAKKKTKGRYLDHVISPREVGRMIRSGRIPSAAASKADSLPGIRMESQPEVREDRKAMMRALGIGRRIMSETGAGRAIEALKDARAGKMECDFLDLMICEGDCGENREGEPVC